MRTRACRRTLAPAGGEALSVDLTEERPRSVPSKGEVALSAEILLRGAPLATPPARGAFASRAFYFLPEGLRRNGRAMIVYARILSRPIPLAGAGMRGSAGAAERRSIVASFQPRQDADPHPRERQGRRRLPARRDSSTGRSRIIRTSGERSRSRVMATHCWPPSLKLSACRSTSCCGWRSPRLGSASRDDPKTA